MEYDEALRIHTRFMSNRPSDLLDGIRIARKYIEWLGGRAEASAELEAVRRQEAVLSKSPTKDDIRRARSELESAYKRLLVKKIKHVDMSWRFFAVRIAMLVSAPAIIGVIIHMTVYSDPNNTAPVDEVIIMAILGSIALVPSLVLSASWYHSCKASIRDIENGLVTTDNRRHGGREVCRKCGQSVPRDAW